MDLISDLSDVINIMQSKEPMSMSEDTKYYLLFPFVIFLICAAVFCPFTQLQIYNSCKKLEYTFFFSLFIILFFSIIFNYLYFEMIVNQFCIKNIY